MNLLGIVGTLLTFAIGLTLGWRWLCRRYSLPFPAWSAGFLANPVVARLIGTQATLDRMNLKPGQRVLEIGPGPGRLLLPAAQHVLPGGEVVGLDIQPGMVERLLARAQQAGIGNLLAVAGDATQPQFAPSSFDVIFLCTVLGEIPDRLAVLRQCYQALKPNGVLAITEIFGDPHFQSRAVVRRLAEESGFRQRETAGHWFFFTASFVKDE